MSRSGDSRVGTLLDCMAHRGSTERSIWRSEGILMATARDEWETEPDFAGPTMIASRGPCRVVCDASLYYREDLKRRLSGGGTRPATESAGDLIAAAFDAFGYECVEHLEGDFAFCVWDEEAEALFCARDPFGMRSIFYAALDDTVFVSSTPHPLVELLGGRAEFDAPGVLRAVLMRPGDGTTTAWKGIRELPAGHSLSISRAGISVARYWTAAGSEHWAGLDESEAIEATRTLLQDAVRVRVPPGGCALAMSGGMDSTAIAACNASPDASGTAGRLRVLSFLFEDGDPASEAWYVDRVAQHLGLPVDWIDVSEVGFFTDALDRARRRSNCDGHLFEGHNRCLARGGRKVGARVLLNGHGGDNLFGVEDWMMADLLRTGRWIAARRFMVERGYRGWRQFLAYCLRPALPYFVLDLLELVLGRRIQSRPFERPLPPWIDADETLVREITEEDRGHYAESVLSAYPSVTGQRRAWALMDAGFQRGCSALFDLTRDEGVELRLPFYDRRLVEFVLSRPPSEFNQPEAYKVLLGKAMEGRLPDRTRKLEPGGFKPGSAISLMKARWSREARSFLDRLSDASWISAELGIVDADRFRCELGRDESLQVHGAADVGLTLFVEAWLRANSLVSGGT